MINNISNNFGLLLGHFRVVLYDACDVTLSVYPHRASFKNMPDHGGNQTYDLWNTSPMLCQLSYAVWSVRVCDISEQNLVPSISMLSNNNHDFFCVGVMYSGEYDACDVTLSVYPHRPDRVAQLAEHIHTDQTA